MAYEHLIYELRGPVVLITLNRPDALNALSRPLENELHAAVDAAEADDAVRRRPWPARRTEISTADNDNEHHQLTRPPR